MYERERIILRLYFPQFNSPLSSRFQNYFSILNKTENTKKKKKTTSVIIFPDKIMQGEDKRTSIVIKNIPRNVKKKDIRNMVEKYGNINFLTIAKDQESENYMKAYLNMINYKSIIPIYMGLRKVTFNYQGNLINIQIVYSEVQGKSELKKIFNNEYFDK
jgi:RNA recognition motif-containing protein